MKAGAKHHAYVETVVEFVMQPGYVPGLAGGDGTKHPF